MLDWFRDFFGPVDPKELAAMAKQLDLLEERAVRRLKGLEQLSRQAAARQEIALAARAELDARHGRLRANVVITRYYLELKYSSTARPVSSSPPRLIEGLFWLVLPRKVRDAIMGDAAEAYAQTIKRYNGRRWMATIDYIKEGLFATFATLRMSFAQWIHYVFKRSS